MKHSWRSFLLGFLIGIGSLVGVAQLDKVLKGAGIGVLVDKFGPQINSFVNKLSGVKEDYKFDTKVVPVISVGNGAYVGAVQVMGDPESVQKVQAVAQLEGDFQGRTFRVKALLPVSTKTPNKSISRVQGVGVSALIDIRL